MSFNSIWEENGLIIIVENDVTNELLQISRALSKDQRVYDIHYIILDLTKVNTFSIDSHTIQQLAVLDAENYQKNQDIKQAFVSSETVAKGLTNMFQTYFEINNNDKSWDTKIFDNIEDAREWLNA